MMVYTACIQRPAEYEYYHNKDKRRGNIGDNIALVEPKDPCVYATDMHKYPF